MEFNEPLRGRAANLIKVWCSKDKNSSRRLRRFTLIIILHLRKSARSAGNKVENLYYLNGL